MKAKKLKTGPLTFRDLPENSFFTSTEEYPEHQTGGALVFKKINDEDGARGYCLDVQADGKIVLVQIVNKADQQGLFAFEPTDIVNMRLMRMPKPAKAAAKAASAQPHTGVNGRSAQ